METLIQKAERLKIKPTGESLLAKAQRLGIKPAEPANQSMWGNPVLDFLDNLGASSGKKVADAWTGAYEGAKEGFSSGTVMGGVHGSARTLEGILAPFGEAINTATLGAIPATVNALDATNYLGRDGIAVLNKVNDFFDKNPDAKTFVLQDLPTFLNTASLKVGGGAVKGTKPLESTAGVVDTVAEALKPKVAVMDEGKIIDNYNRAVRPTVVGKRTAPQIAKQNANIVTGIESIRNNKSKLSFTDAEGNILRGDTPKTVEQLGQAINQVKNQVFKEYDGLAKSAGEKGGAVDLANEATANMNGKLTSVIDELDTVINDKSLAIAKPEAARYAIEMKDRLLYEKTIDAEGVTVRTVRPPMSTELMQSLIEHWNQTLQAYYKNPTYDTALKATIDAMLANKARSLLDQAIESTEGPGYQALKREYGALKSMERDVANRTQVYARQNFKGLIDFTDIATGAGVIHGLITLNPQTVISSLLARGMKEFIKWKNNPDRAIENLFKEANRGGQATPASGQVSPSVGKTPDSPNPQASSKSNSIVSSPNDSISTPNLSSATKGTKPSPKGKGATPPTNPLKYNTVDDFVSAQGDTYYHGGEKIDAIDLKKSGGTFFMSDSKEYTGLYKNKYGGKGVTTEVVLSPKAKLIDIRNADKATIAKIKAMAEGTPTGKTVKIQKPNGEAIELPTTPKDRMDFGSYSANDVIDGAVRGKSHFAEHPTLVEIYKKLGYDGMVSYEDVGMRGKNIGVWNSEVVKTKAELADIYDKSRRAKK